MLFGSSISLSIGRQAPPTTTTYLDDGDRVVRRVRGARRRQAKPRDQRREQRLGRRLHRRRVVDHREIRRRSTIMRASLAMALLAAW